MRVKRERYPSKIEIPMPVRVSFQIDGEAELATGWIARMSLAGVEIVGVDSGALHSSSFGSGVVFHTAFDPDGSEIMTFQGRVQWVDGGRVGVQFTELGVRETRAVLEAMRG
jgi:hypothetical protein